MDKLVTYLDIFFPSYHLLKQLLFLHKYYYNTAQESVYFYLPHKSELFGSECRLAYLIKIKNENKAAFFSHFNN